MAACNLAMVDVRVRFPYAPLEPSEMAITPTVGRNFRFESGGTQSALDMRLRLFKRTVEEVRDTLAGANPVIGLTTPSDTGSECLGSGFVGYTPTNRVWTSLMTGACNLKQRSLR
jgi:hypothetical protein